MNREFAQWRYNDFIVIYQLLIYYRMTLFPYSPAASPARIEAPFHTKLNKNVHLMQLVIFHMLCD